LAENKPTQLDKFKQAARDLECDDDPERFRERVAKVVKQPGKGNFGGLRPMKTRRPPAKPVDKPE